MLDFSKKAETHFDAAEKLATANSRIATLEAEVQSLKEVAAADSGKIVDLTAKLEAAQTLVNAKDSEIVTLKADVVTAKGTAAAVIAAQGLSPDALPPLEPRAEVKDKKNLTMTERCLAAAKANGNGGARN